MNSGVYQIRNVVNNKFYVGSTSDLSRREQDHFSYLRRGRHPNVHLQHSWNKHGESNFVFEVLERCENNVLLEREQILIDETKANKRGIGYNMCPVAGSTLGRRHTEETKKKMSLSRKGRSGLKGAKSPMFGREKSEETKRKISDSIKANVDRPCVKLNWDIVEEIRQKFDEGDISQTELGKQYGVNRSQICRIVKRKVWVK